MLKYSRVSRLERAGPRGSSTARAAPARRDRRPGEAVRERLLRVAGPGAEPEGDRARGAARAEREISAPARPVKNRA